MRVESCSSAGITRADRHREESANFLRRPVERKETGGYHGKVFVSGRNRINSPFHFLSACICSHPSWCIFPVGWGLRLGWTRSSLLLHQLSWNTNCVSIMIALPASESGSGPPPTPRRPTGALPFHPSGAGAHPLRPSVPHSCSPVSWNIEFRVQAALHSGAGLSRDGYRTIRSARHFLGWGNWIKYSDKSGVVL